MDSPIIISDEAHLRHKGDAKGDFKFINARIAQVNDTGFSAKKIECLNMSNCPKTTLTPGWTLDILDSSGKSIIELTSNKADPTIRADFHNRSFAVGHDNDTDGTDLSATGQSF